MAYRTLAPSFSAALPETKAYRLPATVLKADTTAADVQLSDGSILRRLQVAGGIAAGGMAVEVEFNGSRAPVVYAQGNSTGAASGGVLAFGSVGGGGGGGGVPTYRTLTAGNGLTGGGDLSADRTFHVGQGDGISIGADDVAVDSTVVRITRTLTAGNGLTGGGTLAADRTFDVAVANTGAIGLTVEADAVRLTSSSNPSASAAVLASNSSGYLQLVRIGLGTAPLLPLHVFGSGAQFRLEADSLYPVDFEADASGNIWLQPYGEVIVDAGGETMRPANNRTTDLGAPAKEWLTAFIAEIRASTLIAQDIMSTIGGQLYIAPSNILVSSFTSSM